jgi:hypothetical protein
LQKHIIFQEANNQSEENFSHNNRIDQSITNWHHCHSAFVAKKHGAAKTGTGKTQNTGWSYVGW